MIHPTGGRRTHMATEPATTFDARFSDANAKATPWRVGRRALADARLYWLITLRSGRPHATPLIGLWDDDGFVFTTGPDEQKARNLGRDARCSVSTGDLAYAEGLDVVVEGSAVRVSDDATLARLAETYVAKYGEDWRFSVADGEFHHEAGSAHVFRVTPDVAFGFAKSPYGQTRWRFSAEL
jgi:nitroimidazol reductase NimA-like FMN-containing flavoprotein (pyridoxamine 5'-phosphate oxidase superfamily)